MAHESHFNSIQPDLERLFMLAAANCLLEDFNLTLIMKLYNSCALPFAFHFKKSPKLLTDKQKGKPFFLSFLSRLSGFMLPSPIVSSGSILALWFTTDFAVSAQGFKAVYEGKMTCDRVAGPSEQIIQTSNVPENRTVLPVET